MLPRAVVDLLAAGALFLGHAAADPAQLVVFGATQIWPPVLPLLWRIGGIEVVLAEKKMSSVTAFLKGLKSYLPNSAFSRKERQGSSVPDCVR